MAALGHEEKDANLDLRLELYKSLRAEVVGYVEKVPGLWLQKFALVGETGEGTTSA